MVFRIASPTLKHKEVITVTAYLPSHGAKLADSLPTIGSLPKGMNLPSPVERLRAGRFARGIDVTLPNGRKLLFGEINELRHQYNQEPRLRLIK